MPPNSALSVACSRSASAKMRQAESPASSADRSFRCVAASRMTCRPGAVSPANESRATWGCATRASRASVRAPSPLPLQSPVPYTMLTTASGRPAPVVISASSAAGSGVHTYGLSTTVQLATRADARSSPSSARTCPRAVPQGLSGPNVPACEPRCTGRRPPAAGTPAQVTGSEADTMTHVGIRSHAVRRPPGRSSAGLKRHFQRANCRCCSAIQITEQQGDQALFHHRTA